MTRQIGIIGYPLKHSVSPVFQQAALDFYGLDVKYKVWEVEKVEWGLAELRKSETIGANVTVPYKEAIIPFLDSLDPQAWDIGAVNTIVREDKSPGAPEGAPDISILSKDNRPHARLTGYNTDVSGFLRALKDDAGFEPKGKIAVLLGAGGVARAAAFALLRAEVNSLVIFNRTPGRGRSLVEALHEKVKGKQSITARAWREDVMRRIIRQADLIVNCTTIGMRYSPGAGQSPLSAALIPSEALAYDLVYNPLETPFIEEAKRAGALTLSGLSMLIYQGAAAFELWTGKKAPLDIMFGAARKALE